MSHKSLFDGIRGRSTIELSTFEQVRESDCPSHHTESIVGRLSDIDVPTVCAVPCSTESNIARTSNRMVSHANKPSRNRDTSNNIKCRLRSRRQLVAETSARIGETFVISLNNSSGMSSAVSSDKIETDIAKCKGPTYKPWACKQKLRFRRNLVDSREKANNSTFELSLASLACTKNDLEGPTKNTFRGTCARKKNRRSRRNLVDTLGTDTNNATIELSVVQPPAHKNQQTAETTMPEISDTGALRHSAGSLLGSVAVVDVSKQTEAEDGKFFSHRMSLDQSKGLDFSKQGIISFHNPGEEKNSSCVMPINAATSQATPNTENQNEAEGNGVGDPEEKEGERELGLRRDLADLLSVANNTTFEISIAPSNALKGKQGVHFLSDPTPSKIADAQLKLTSSDIPCAMTEEHPDGNQFEDEPTSLALSHVEVPKSMLESVVSFDEKSIQIAPARKIIYRGRRAVQNIGDSIIQVDFAGASLQAVRSNTDEALPFAGNLTLESRPNSADQEHKRNRLATSNLTADVADKAKVTVCEQEAEVMITDAGPVLMSGQSGLLCATEKGSSRVEFTSMAATTTDKRVLEDGGVSSSSVNASPNTEVTLESLASEDANVLPSIEGHHQSIQQDLNLMTATEADLGSVEVDKMASSRRSTSDVTAFITREISPDFEVVSMDVSKVAVSTGATTIFARQYSRIDTDQVLTNEADRPDIEDVSMDVCQLGMSVSLLTNASRSTTEASFAISEATDQLEFLAQEKQNPLVNSRVSIVASDMEISETVPAQLGVVTGIPSKANAARVVVDSQPAEGEPTRVNREEAISVNVGQMDAPASSVEWMIPVDENSVASDAPEQKRTSIGRGATPSMMTSEVPHSSNPAKEPHLLGTNNSVASAIINKANVFDFAKSSRNISNRRGKKNEGISRSHAMASSANAELNDEFTMKASLVDNGNNELGLVEDDHVISQTPQSSPSISATANAACHAEVECLEELSDVPLLPQAFLNRSETQDLIFSRGERCSVRLGRNLVDGLNDKVDTTEVSSIASFVGGYSTQKSFVDSINQTDPLASDIQITKSPNDDVATSKRQGFGGKSSGCVRNNETIPEGPQPVSPRRVWPSPVRRSGSLGYTCPSLSAVPLMESKSNISTRRFSRPTSVLSATPSDTTGLQRRTITQQEINEIEARLMNISADAEEMEEPRIILSNGATVIAEKISTQAAPPVDVPDDFLSSSHLDQSKLQYIALMPPPSRPPPLKHHDVAFTDNMAAKVSAKVVSMSLTAPNTPKSTERNRSVQFAPLAQVLKQHPRGQWERLSVALTDQMNLSPIHRSRSRIACRFNLDDDLDEQENLQANKTIGPSDISGIQVDSNSEAETKTESNTSMSPTTSDPHLPDVFYQLSPIAIEALNRWREDRPIIEPENEATAQKVTEETYIENLVPGEESLTVEQMKCVFNSLQPPEPSYEDSSRSTRHKLQQQLAEKTCDIDPSMVSQSQWLPPPNEGKEYDMDALSNALHHMLMGWVEPQDAIFIPLPKSAYQHHVDSKPGLRRSTRIRVAPPRNSYERVHYDVRVDPITGRLDMVPLGYLRYPDQKEVMRRKRLLKKRREMEDKDTAVVNKRFREAKLKRLASKRRRILGISKKLSQEERRQVIELESDVTWVDDGTGTLPIGQVINPNGPSKLPVIFDSWSETQSYLKGGIIQGVTECELEPGCGLTHLGPFEQSVHDITNIISVQQKRRGLHFDGKMSNLFILHLTKPDELESTTPLLAVQIGNYAIPLKKASLVLVPKGIPYKFISVAPNAIRLSRLQFVPNSK